MNILLKGKGIDTQHITHVTMHLIRDNTDQEPMPFDNPPTQLGRDSTFLFFIDAVPRIYAA